jgi:hypothetical protein
MINGPVANKGQSKFINNKGTNVPISDAIIITETNAVVTITPMTILTSKDNDSYE